MTDPGPQLGRVGRALLSVASFALVAMMLAVVIDVVLRFVFNTPLRGAYDMVSIFLLVMVFFGIGPVIALGREILIDLIDKAVPTAALRGIRLVAAIGTLAVTLFIAWSMIAPARDAYRYGDRSLELGLPVWTFWAIAFVGIAGILWGAVRALIAAFNTARLDDPQAEADP